MAPKSQSVPEDVEWKALVVALQMYKAAYGDLKVPSRFIVPGMPPWPGKNHVHARGVLACTAKNSLLCYSIC
jgi:hypothetical protein